MAIRAKQLQIPDHVILMVPIQMMNLRHQFFSIPIPDSTYLTMGIAVQDAPNVFFYQIHCLDPGSKTEDFSILPVDKLTLIMPAIPSLCGPVIKMRCIQLILANLSLQGQIITSHFWNAEPVQAIKPAIRVGNRFLHALLGPIVLSHLSTSFLKDTNKNSVPRKKPENCCRLSGPDC